MKLKFLALSLALVAGVAANAQTATKCNDVFVGVGGGVISTLTPGFNTLQPYFNVEVGAYVHPAWAVRAVVAGPWQALDANNNNALTSYKGKEHFSQKHKVFGEINADVIFNISQAFADDFAKLDFYVFTGPTVNLSTAGTVFAAASEQKAAFARVEYSDDLKVRVGATAGLGLAYNFTKTFALGLEARAGITPSIFGDADAYRKAEGTTRFTLNGVWTIGGRHGKIARAAAAAAAIGYISPAAAQALADEAVAKNPKIVEKIVEKEVVKEVEKLVNNNTPASTAIFFEIGKSSLSTKDQARVKLLADAIKADNSDTVYEVGGYADKKTGSAKLNQTLSEKRAQAVYDALVSEGVSESKLEKKAYGGVDAIFYNNDVLSRTVIVKAE